MAQVCSPTIMANSLTCECLSLTWKKLSKLLYCSHSDS